MQQGQTVPLQNPYVYGNAWFVDRIKYVENADQELDALGLIDLRHEAVADKDFKATLQDTANQEGESVVTLTDYRPNELVYNLDSDRGGVVVFSEIFYPGWTATIDGEPAQLGRVDYVLRALRVPAGNHEVVLTFKPASIRKTESVAYASYFVLLLAIGVGLFVEW